MDILLKTGSIRVSCKLEFTSDLTAVKAKSPMISALIGLCFTRELLNTKAGQKECKMKYISV